MSSNLFGICLFGGALTLALGYYFWYKKIKVPSSGKMMPRCLSKVIFFPDNRVPCGQIVRILGSYEPEQWPDFLVSGEFPCRNRSCRLYHRIDSPFAQLMMGVANARHSLDICVYVITSEELLNLVIDMQKFRHIKVRVITDMAQQSDERSRVADLRRANIPVLSDASSYNMHHKFCLVDEEILLCGSFNWTRSAFVGNCENVIVTPDPDIVRPYVLEFRRLWKLYTASPSGANN